MTEATQAVEGYHISVDAVDRSNRQLKSLVIALCSVTIAIVIGLGIFISVEVSSIRSTQKANTAVSHCQNRAFDQVLGEVLLNQKVTAPPKC